MAEVTPTWEPPIAERASPRPIQAVPRSIGYYAVGLQLYQLDRGSGEYIVYDGDPAEYLPVVV